MDEERYNLVLDLYREHFDMVSFCGRLKDHVNDLLYRSNLHRLDMKYVFSRLDRIHEELSYIHCRHRGSDGTIRAMHPVVLFDRVFLRSDGKALLAGYIHSISLENARLRGELMEQVEKADFAGKMLYSRFHGHTDALVVGVFEKVCNMLAFIEKESGWKDRGAYRRGIAEMLREGTL